MNQIIFINASEQPLFTNVELWAGVTVLWINCLTLEAEFLGSYPGYEEVFFSVLSSSSFSLPWFYSVGGVPHVVPL